MYWTFVINKDFYFDLKEQDKIKWNTAKEVKKGDIILIYTGSPYSNIGFILKVISEPFEDSEIRKEWDRPAIMVEKLAEMPKPIELSELRENPILSNWGAVRMGFRGSHFKMSEEEWEEMKKLILEKNPELENEIEVDNYEIDSQILDPRDIQYYDLNAGRAHIVRDLCYLISENSNLTDEKLSNLLRRKVGNNNDYWKAYYLRSSKDNSPQYSLNSARALGLVEKNSLQLTEKGQELANLSTIDELFTHNYDLEVKKFFFKCAVSIPSIKTAMEILREKKELRFYSPTCKEIDKVTWDWKIKDGKVICESDKFNKCKSCDKDFMSHIKESSLPLETLQSTNGEGYGFVFWMCSRVTPMHLKGSDPVYSGNYIYWDEEAEEELGNLTDNLDKNKDVRFPQVWKITPGALKTGEQEKIWPLYKKTGFIGIGWLHNSKSYLDFNTPDELKEAIKTFHGYEEERKNPSQATNMVWDFTHKIKKGDIIVANKTKGIIRGIGVVVSDYIDPYNSENPGIFNYFWHLRKINWIINEEIELDDKHFFDIKTVTHLKNEKWEKIKAAYIKKDPEYAELFKQMENNSPISNNFDEESIEIIHSLFKEFSDNYLDTNIGVEHLEFHSKEREEVKKYFNKIKNDPKIVFDDSDPIINYILPIKRFSVAPAGVKNFSAFKNPLEVIPKITLDLFKLVTDLINTDDKKEQNRLIHLFKDKNYRGFQSGILTSVFYYLNSDLWYINNKTVNTFNFISEILGNDDKINGNLNDYIDNLSKIKKLLNKLSIHIPELSDFEVFDVFCHWMCDKNLGNYALDKEKFEKWLHKEDIGDDSGIIIEPKYHSFNDYLNEQNFIYTPEMIENFLLSLKVKPFVILTGNSGTGKTKIAQLFAEYLQHKNEGDFIIIPVGANWTENRHLMGFYNVITSDYQSTPALDLMIKARDDPLKPYFLILDEMNLSHVERYFSDFLSAIESGKEISLYSPPENAEDMQNSNIPEKIKIPNNLFVVGTVNVDETTYMFSPKVLDRANTIEFKTYPARDYIMCQIEPELPQGSVEYLENLLSPKETRKSKINELKNDMEHIIVQDNNLWEVLASEIHKFQEVLSEAGFDFGFRVIDEVMRFMYAAWLYEDSPENWDNWQRYFDTQIMQKMLPKIHGSQQELNSVLEKLFELCYNGESLDKSWYITEVNLNDLNYPFSAHKLQKMARKLHAKRFVSFTD